jgi:hypothetical protein
MFMPKKSATKAHAPRKRAIFTPSSLAESSTKKNRRMSIHSRILYELFLHADDLCDEFEQVRPVSIRTNSCERDAQTIFHKCFSRTNGHQNSTWSMRRAYLQQYYSLVCLLLIVYFPLQEPDGRDKEMPFMISKIITSNMYLPQKVQMWLHLPGGVNQQEWSGTDIAASL